MLRTLHGCWLVDPWKPSRERFLRSWLAAGWNVVLWHNGQLAAAPVEGVELRDAREILERCPTGLQEAFAYELRHENHAACADLFRYAVLFEQGGAYFDIDIKPGPAATPVRLADVTLPAFGQHFTRLAWHLEIRFIFAPVAKHELFTCLVETAARNTLEFMADGGYAKRGFGNLLLRTGPQMAEKVVYAYAKQQGVPNTAFLLKNATLDMTPENSEEHYSDKVPRVLEIAGYKQ